jgi:hypothetical protein
MGKQLTPMQQFALEFISKQKVSINPGYLATEWYFHKNGRYPPAASRDRFGLTSAAYKTLRKLAKMGLINQELSSTSGGYRLEHFSSKK